MSRNSISCTKLLRGHLDDVLCVSMNGNDVVSGGHDCTVRVWSILGGEASHLLQGVATSFHFLQNLKISSLIIFPNSWTGHTDSVTSVVWGHGNNSLHRDVPDVPDGFVISCSLDATIRIWSLKDRRVSRVGPTLPPSLHPPTLPLSLHPPTLPSSLSLFILLHCLPLSRLIYIPQILQSP